MQHQASLDARRHARDLRVGMTDAERLLWGRLRLRQLGVKFRRQHPVGPFILDFACLDPKLAIEVDGSQHLQQMVYDEHRSRWLAGEGFTVLRFWANQVMSETDAVVAAIHHALWGREPAPTPALPQRGREPESTSKLSGFRERAHVADPLVEERGPHPSGKEP